MADALAPPAVDSPVDAGAPPAADTPARTPHSPPNWAVVTADVPCPLCDYSLRGLAEPRCPECGYASNWHDLLNREKFQHPYLFEHHARRQPLRSYLKTLAGGRRPHRFWTSLDANHRAYPRRLVAYWLIGVLFTLTTGFGVRYFADGLKVWDENEASRRGMLATAAGPGGAGYARQFTRSAYGSLAAYLDTVFPLPPSKRFFQQVWSQSDVTLALKIVLLFVSWPLATYAVLMIFRTSMRRARVRPVHVLRCAVYSGDVAAWLGLLWMVLLLLNRDNASHNRAAAETALMAALLLWAVATYRLVVAYHHYLRFDRPAAVVLCSQLILGLAAACLLVQDFVWLLL